jgi:hypothetical protein
MAKGAEYWNQPDYSYRKKGMLPAVHTMQICIQDYLTDAGLKPTVAEHSAIAQLLTTMRERAWMTEARYERYTRAVLARIQEHMQMPHTDLNVLHAPLKCMLCSEFKDLQDVRIRENIAFTGEPWRDDCPKTMVVKYQDVLQCPAERIRDIRLIETSPSNRARGHGPTA